MVHDPWVARRCHAGTDGGTALRQIHCPECGGWNEGVPEEETDGLRVGDAFREGDGDYDCPRCGAGMVVGPC